MGVWWMVGSAIPAVCSNVPNVVWRFIKPISLGSSCQLVELRIAISVKDLLGWPCFLASLCTSTHTMALLDQWLLEDLELSFLASSREFGYHHDLCTVKLVSLRWWQRRLWGEHTSSQLWAETAATSEAIVIVFMIASLGLEICFWGYGNTFVGGCDFCLEYALWVLT